MMWMQVRISAQLDAGVQHQPAGEVEIDIGMKLDQEKAARRVRIARSDQRAHFVRRMDPRGVPHAQIAEKHSPVDRNQQTVFRNILQHGNAAALQLCNYAILTRRAAFSWSSFIPMSISTSPAGWC